MCKLPLLTKIHKLDKRAGSNTQKELQIVRNLIDVLLNLDLDWIEADRMLNNFSKSI